MANKKGGGGGGGVLAECCSSFFSFLRSIDCIVIGATQKKQTGELVRIFPLGEITISPSWLVLGRRRRRRKKGKRGERREWATIIIIERMGWGKENKNRSRSLTSGVECRKKTLCCCWGDFCRPKYTKKDCVGKK